MGFGDKEILLELSGDVLKPSFYIGSAKIQKVKIQYELAKLTVLMPAINAVQSTVGSPKGPQFSYVEVLDPTLV
jgi:hypothetical protein